VSTIAAHTDGSLRGIENLLREQPLDAVREEVVGVLANSLDLVATFVGEDLTGRIISARWPNISVRDLGSAREDAARS
jgi:hypothetical protein